MHLLADTTTDALTQLLFESPGWVVLVLALLALSGSHAYSGARATVNNEYKTMVDQPFRSSLPGLIYSPSLAASLGVLAGAAALIHLSNGAIEAHFHIFVVLVFVALYQDCGPWAARSCSPCCITSGSA